MSTLANIRRPASWNAKMVLSGQPLITDAQFEKLLANGEKQRELYSADFDPVPVVKIFLPHVRWLLCYIKPDDYNFVGAVEKFGNEPPQVFEMYLSDIVNSRLGTGALGIAPERDKYLKLDKPMSWYVKHPEAW